MFEVKVVAAGLVLGAGVALGAITVGTGVANASPAVSGPEYLSQGPGRHDHDDDDWRWRDRGPRRWDPIDACVGFEGPFGYVSGGACI